MTRASIYTWVHKLSIGQGTLVINSLCKPGAGGLGVSRGIHGIVSTAYGVYRLRSSCHSRHMILVPPQLATCVHVPSMV